MKFRILAALAMLLLSAPSALGVQRALSPTRGELAGWLAALGIELAYLSLAFLDFDDQQRQRSAARVAKTAVATAIVLNVLADYAARVPSGLTGAAQFLATFDWLLLALSVLESAPLAGLAYTLAVLLHTRSSKQHSADAAQHTSSSMQQYADEHPAASAVDAQHQQQYAEQYDQHTADTQQQMLSSMLRTAEHPAASAARYACPRCSAALTQQQYAAAKRYGRCVKCKQ